jgi:cystathionine beta-lyase
VGKTLVVDFDKIIDREGTASLKYDARKTYFGDENLIPLWVADMDFSAPEVVTNALIQRASHPIYGYTLYPDSLFTVTQNWFQQQHNWSIERNSILMCPGVVPSIHAAIEALSDVSDSVIVQPPIYPPFFSAVRETNRNLIENPLKLERGIYHIDFEHLEQCAASGAKLLLLCSPHNPVGRVWRQDELETLLDIARRYQLTIISDEIHADLIYPEYKHIPLATLSNDVAIVTAISPSKTFNIPGLGLSCLVATKREHRQAIKKVFDSWHVSASNPFSIAAFEAAYAGGASWLNELMQYLDETRRQVCNFIETHIPKIKIVSSQGTYLLWLDCREMGLNDDRLSSFFIDDVGVAMNAGISFGHAGSGFMRMNIAAPRALILEACQRMMQVESMIPR